MSPFARRHLGLSLLLMPASLVRGENAFGITIQLPTHVPAWAEPLSPHLASLSIEMDRWTDWAGAEVGHPNKYVNQLLRNLGERTGSMPFLRVGGESTVPWYTSSLSTCLTYSHPLKLSLGSMPATVKSLTRVSDMGFSEFSR